LQPLGSDQDVLFMAKYVEEGHKLIDVYVENERTNPDLYFTSPLKTRRLVIQELEDDEPRQSRAGSTKVSRKMVVDVNVGQSSKSAKDAWQISKGAKDACQISEGAKDVEPYVPSQGNNAFVNDFYSSYDPYVESQDPNFDLFDDLDSILPTNTTHQAEPNVGDKDDLDIDYIMDDENYVDDVYVDIEDFHYNIDETIEFMGSKNRVKTFDEEEIKEDVEVLDNDYFESDSNEENELD
nr:hypothetical protein [Tanacetum cinerariifolium]